MVVDLVSEINPGHVCPNNKYRDSPPHAGLSKPGIMLLCNSKRLFVI